MANITNIFEKAVADKIKAKTILDDKISESRKGFNLGVSYLEGLCEQLQEHIPTLGCQLLEPTRSNGHFVFDANGVRIVVQLWGKYNADGSGRAGFYKDEQLFTLLYKDAYWCKGESFEEKLVKDLVKQLSIVQMS